MHCLRWTWLQRRNLKCGRERGGGRQRGKTCLRELSCCNAGVWKADEASKWDAGSASGIAGSASEIDGKSHRSRNPLERWQTRDKTEVTTAPMSAMLPVSSSESLSRSSSESLSQPTWDSGVDRRRSSEGAGATAADPRGCGKSASSSS